MGILLSAAKLVEDLNLPKGFSVCELGDQIYRGVEKIEKPVDRYGYPAKQWYEKLGCGKYVSIDGNDNATLKADLNYPLPDIGQFDLVTDFGTGEHIFNQAQVWISVHNLTKVGGYIVFDRPYQGFPDHCFYNSHPTLFKDIAQDNEYNLLKLKIDEVQIAPGRVGLFIRGVMQKTKDQPFRYPTQTKYRHMLNIKR